MPEFLYDLATWLLPLTFAIVFHEVAHGWVARAFGDRTASNAGRLSLNPVRHIDPFGTIVLPMMLALAHAPVFGWARPVPVDDRAFRDPKRDMALVAMAGPATNFLLAMASAIALGLLLRWRPGDTDGFVAVNLSNFIVVNLALGVFNLLPIPPFDGSRIVGGVLPDRLAERWRALDRYALLFMIGLLVVLPMLAPRANVVERVVGPPVGRLADELDAITNWVART